jgi:hypothetical protein
MFATIARSYHIFCESLSILRKDKELLIFPVLSGLFTILAFAGLVFGGVVTGFFERVTSSGEGSLESELLGYSALFVWYFVSWFIVIFFNVAIIHCAKIRLDGGDPTVADGFAAAKQHLGRILLWALISATVGLILRVIAERAKFVGRLIAWIVGAAWAIATYFIIPVMIFEKRSIRDSVRQSTALIAKTWGESLVAAAGVGVFSMILAVAGLALPVLGLFISPTAAVVGLVLMVAYWIALSVLTSALSGIFRAGLYVYATENRVPPGISPDHVQNAFAVKGAKRAIRFA